MQTDDTKTVHKYLNLKQIDKLRDACYEIDYRYSNEAKRNEVIIVLLADLGLRVSELVQLKRTMFDLDNKRLQLPAHIQKDYPIDDLSPSSARLQLDPYDNFSTVRLLRSYFKQLDNNYILPSRESDKISTRSVENMLKKVSAQAEVSPKRTDGQASQPSDVHPHAFRHSLASYMLSDKDTRLVDVKYRLRHRSIQTTEQIYTHFKSR